MPVLEVLLDPRATVSKVVIARGAHGDAIGRIIDVARERGVHVEWAAPARVTHMSGNGRHDQGVVADVSAPQLAQLEDWLPGRTGPLVLLLLDGVTNPANVGMIIRTATAAGLDGVVVPRAGCPNIGPLVVKASAGVALSARVLQAADAAGAAAALAAEGIELVGLAPSAGTSLWELDVAGRTALVLGNETTGLSAPVSALVARWCTIPLARGVASLNVAAAAAVVTFELARRAERDPG